VVSFTTRTLYPPEKRFYENMETQSDVKLALLFVTEAMVCPTLRADNCCYGNSVATFME